MTPSLPSLPYAEWQGTRPKLHLLCQMLGKVRLALHPPRNHWWHATLQVGARGILSGPVTVRPGTPRLEMELDLRAHRLRLRRGAAATETPLEGTSVAELYAWLMAELTAMGVGVRMRARPYDPDKVGSHTPFAEDDRRAYDPAVAERFLALMTFAADALETFAGEFNGKASPAQLFWHSLDLAHTRFSGRAAPLAGGSASDREAYSHELLSFGFWAGDPAVPEPAFYAYAYPEPAGLTGRPLPPGARWSASGSGHLALLPWETVRAADDPLGTALDFCRAVHRAGAELAAWDPALTRPGG